MRKGKNTAEIYGSDDEFDDLESLESNGEERTLVLKKPPRSRRVQLLAQGAKEIRCIICHQIKALNDAEEFDEGWVCQECAALMTRTA